MPYQLKSEQVVICGETLNVFQASNEMDIERSLMISEAKVKTEATTEDARGQFIYYVSVLLYPSLAACTKGNVPTLEDFLYHIPTEDSDRWTTVAKRMNPGWFKFIADAEESVEKKDEQQTSSTSV